MSGDHGDAGGYDSHDDHDIAPAHLVRHLGKELLGEERRPRDPVDTPRDPLNGDIVSFGFAS